MDSTSFIKIEEKFTAKLPPSQKILCCKPATAVTIICVLLILSNINYFMTLPFRWGKPCFFWWEHWATIVTFVSTTAIRVAVLPLAVLALLDHQKKGTQWLQILFHAMLGLSAVFALDAFLCVFEVNEVCESGAMKQFQDCASDWGRWAADAPLHVNQSAIEGGFRCPESCKTDTYDFQYACTCNDGSAWVEGKTLAECQAGEPSRTSGIRYRGGLDATVASRQEALDKQKSFCEWFSTIYDVILNVILCGVMVGAAFAINSYRLAGEETTTVSSPASGLELEEGKTQSD